MKRIISWIEPRRSRLEKFSSPEPLGFYKTSAGWKPVVFHNHAAKKNETKSSGEERDRNRPNIVIRPIKFQTGLFRMPNSEDRYNSSFTPHLAYFILTGCTSCSQTREGGTPLYKPYRYVPPHRVGFLRRFGLKTGIIYTLPIWSGMGYGFRGNYGVYERFYSLNSKWVRKKEK